MLQDIVLDFFPGPIHAVDGDRGLCSPVSYAILSGTIHTNASKCLKSTVLHEYICYCVCVHVRRR